MARRVERDLALALELVERLIQTDNTVGPSPLETALSGVQTGNIAVAVDAPDRAQHVLYQVTMCVEAVVCESLGVTGGALLEGAIEVFTDSGSSRDQVALYLALDACQSVAGEAAGAMLAELVRKDFEGLLVGARDGNWTDRACIPPTFCGNLWPNGLPEGWPVRAIALEKVLRAGWHGMRTLASQHPIGQLGLLLERLKKAIWGK